MLADEFPEMGIRGPKSLGGTPVAIHVYVDDVDVTFEKALGAGGNTLRAVEDKPTETGAVSSKIPSVTAGASPLTSRTSALRRSSNIGQLPG